MREIWYANEWGYSNRVVDRVNYIMAKTLNFYFTKRRLNG
jgi:hypothetical protein